MDDIRDYISKYISYDQNNEEYAVDAFSDYVYLDKKLVDENINEIRYFLANKIFLCEGNISSYCLLVDNNKRPWNIISSLEDIRLFNYIYALAVASGMVIESFMGKYNYYTSVMDYKDYFDNDNLSLENTDVREDYLDAMRSELIPRFSIFVEPELLKLYTKKDVSEENMKLINYWVNKKCDLSEIQQAKIKRLIATNSKSLLTYIVYCHKFGKELELSSILDDNKEYQTMIDIDNYFKSLKPKELEAFEKNARKVIGMIKTSYISDKTQNISKIKKP